MHRLEHQDTASTSPYTLLDWLILTMTPGLGNARLTDLIKHFGDAAPVRQASFESLSQLGLSKELIASIHTPEPATVESAEHNLQWGEDDLNHIVPLNHPNYPARLKELPDAPLILFIRGPQQCFSLLDEPQIAIVGARTPSAGGRKIAAEFAQHLAAAGFTITSGLARGIDTCAHQSALDAQGTTIAITASGQDIIYPWSNRGLAEQIVEQGLIVSEFPLRTPPLPDHFPRRNRIISGLSLGVVVIEAKVRSGALITARLANEQGCEVFAVPGSIYNPMCKGCHHLIRQGATLVENAQQIIDEVKDQIDETLLDSEPHSTAVGLDKLGAEQRKLLEHIGYELISMDELAELTGFSIEDLSSMLLALELENHISNDNGFYCRIS